MRNEVKKYTIKLGKFIKLENLAAPHDLCLKFNSLKDERENLLDCVPTNGIRS